ncbi:MAG TPA: YceD family protein [Sulfuricella sp.]|nr:YceD family protein [Sulfuricella sp.]
MPEQVIINSIEFARNSESLHGKVQVESLDRLRDLLFSNSGALEYTLTGKRDGDGKFFLTCIIKGVLQLRCQRCLGAFSYPVSLDSELELVEHDPDLAAEHGLTDAIKADPNMDVLALVEDEVLLDLPMAPMHSPEDCQAGGNFGQTKTVKQNAFSALAALKTQDSRKI